MERAKKIQEIVNGGDPSAAVKQSFIFSKMAPNVNSKAITRKMRPPLVDNTTNEIKDQLNSSAPMMDSTYMKTETAIPDTAVGTHSSQGGQDYGAFDTRSNRRDIGSFYRTGGEVAKRTQSQPHYEDNIGSETEVFIDPKFDEKRATLKLESRLQMRKKSQEEHAHEIDAVIKSNHDEGTKRQLIADIQSNYRNSQRKLGQQLKPRNQKKFREGEEDQIQPDNGPLRRRINWQDQFDQATKAKTAIPGARQKQRGRGVGNNGTMTPADYEDSQRGLTHDMNNFFGDGSQTRQQSQKNRNMNYLSQDDTPDYNNKLTNTTKQKQRNRAKNKITLTASYDASAAALAQSNLKMKVITPGRIRASRMGNISNMQEYFGQSNNYVMNNSNGGGNQELNRTIGLMDKQRARAKTNMTQIRPNTTLESAGNADDYNDLLPSVKTMQKAKARRTRSKSPQKSPQRQISPGRNKSPDNFDRNSLSPGQNKKLKPTLDQGLHFAPASVKVPAKQTLLYDAKHQSNITDQTMKTWNVMNGQVILDTFNKAGKKVPVNRHRIPNVGCPDTVDLKSSVRPEQFTWDNEGRRHKKSPRRNRPDIPNENAESPRKNLPNINLPNRFQNRSKGNKSQPAGRMNKIPPENDGKFIDPSTPAGRQKIRPIPSKLNQQSGHDISLQPPNRDINPKKRAHPNNNDLLTSDDDDTNLRDYDCPVCKKRVPGRKTPKHSRKCRTHRCRYCKKEISIDILDKHEVICGDLCTCPYCKLDFPRPDFIIHEQLPCPEASQCCYCHLLMPKQDLPVHEPRCGRISCPFCRLHFARPDFLNHEKNGCPEAANCQYCQVILPKRDIPAHEVRCCRVICPFCRLHFPRPEFTEHEKYGCPDRANCQYCHVLLPRIDLPDHELKCCRVACPFCKMHFPRTEFNDHERVGCPEAVPCPHCYILIAKKDLAEHEPKCVRFELCRFCRRQFRLTELLTHEQRCSDRITCDFCSVELSKEDYDFHLERCPEVATCRFCSNMYPIKDIGIHEGSQCPDVSTCKFCNQVILKELFDQHVIENCPKAKPGIFGDKSVDPRPYQTMLLQQKQLLEKNKNSNVVVEDQFVKAKDFRDPASRRRNSSVSNSRYTKKLNEIKQKSSNKAEEVSNLRQTQKLNESKQKQSIKAKEKQSPYKVNSDILSSRPRKANTLKPRDALSPNSREALSSKSRHVLSPKSRETISPLPQETLQPRAQPSPMPREALTPTARESPLHKLRKENTLKPQEALSHKPREASSPKPQESPSGKPRKANTLKPQETNLPMPRPREASSSTPRESLSRKPRKANTLKPQESPQRKPRGALSPKSPEVASPTPRESTSPRESPSNKPRKVNTLKPQEALSSISQEVLLPKQQEALSPKPQEAPSPMPQESTSHKPPISLTNPSVDQTKGILKVDKNDSYNQLEKLEQQKETFHKLQENFKQTKQDSVEQRTQNNSQIEVKITEESRMKTAKSQGQSQVRFAHQDNNLEKKTFKQTTSELNIHTQENNVQEVHEVQKVQKVQKFQEVLVTEQSTFSRAVKVEKSSNHQMQQSTRVSHQESKTVAIESIRRAQSVMGGEKRVTTTESKAITSGKSSVRRNTVQSSQRNSAQIRSSVSKKMQRKSVQITDKEDRLHSLGSTKSKKDRAGKVMTNLTHNKVKIDNKTKLLINGSEVLSTKGIKGKLHKVGVGFGTGRHTSGRRIDLLKEVPFATEIEVGLTGENEYMYSSTPLVQPIVNHHRRRPTKVDTGVQHDYDMQSEGCDPILCSVRNCMVSAHVSQRDIMLSARTCTVHGDFYSVGCSACPLSQRSLREQADQVTEGRFEPAMINQQIGTDSKLMEAYFQKDMADFEVNTQPIIIIPVKPTTTSCMVQTDDRLNESNLPDDPQPAKTANEPITAHKNQHTGSHGSLLDEPEPVAICTVPVCNYIDDWMESEIYNYSFELNYDRMVKKKLIRIEVLKRPVVPREQEGMTVAQRLEHNLNPDKLQILTQIECEYGQATLKHKSANLACKEILTDLYKRSKTTIELLETNMVRPDVSSHILFTHYKEVSKKNVIKLLIRAKKLYEARNESINILKLVMEAEAIMQPKELVWRVLQNNQCKALIEIERSLIMRAMKILSDALTHITIFQQEHKLFKDELRFNQRYCRAYMREFGEVIGGFLKLHGEPNPSLQETGLLLEDHSESEKQIHRYEEWLKASYESYGQLDIPSAEEIEQTLQPEKPNRKVKGSRIDRALEKLRREQALRSESSSSKDMMELTTKSKILEQMQVKYKKEESWQKTCVSDQMIERMQMSAEKKTKISRERHEKQTTQEAFYESGSHREQTRQLDSIASSANVMEEERKKTLGNYENYRALEASKYQFDLSSQDKISQQKETKQQNHCSIQESSHVSYLQYQQALTLGMQFSAQTVDLQRQDHLQSHEYYSSRTGAERETITSQTNISRSLQQQQQQTQQYVPSSAIEVSQVNDGGTEFTEQCENNIGHDLVLETEVERVDQSASALGDEAIEEQGSPFRGLRVLNQEKIQIKCAAASTTAQFKQSEYASAMTRSKAKILSTEQGTARVKKSLHIVQRHQQRQQQETFSASTYGGAFRTEKVYEEDREQQSSSVSVTVNSTAIVKNVENSPKVMESYQHAQLVSHFDAQHQNNGVQNYSKISSQSYQAYQVGDQLVEKHEASKISEINGSKVEDIEDSSVKMTDLAEQTGNEPLSSRTSQSEVNVAMVSDKTAARKPQHANLSTQISARIQQSNQIEESAQLTVVEDKNFNLKDDSRQTRDKNALQIRI